VEPRVEAGVKFIVALGLVMLWYALMLVWVWADNAIRYHEDKAHDDSSGDGDQ